MVYETVYLVVIYNKLICDSQTLVSLGKKQFTEDDLLVIWNNGPNKIELGTDFSVFHHVELIQTIENLSLSTIYNKTITDRSFDRIVILDDDSSLTCEYLSAVKTIGRESIGIPQIWSSGKVRSPKVKTGLLSYGTKNQGVKQLFAIGSGLVLGQEFCNCLIREYSSVFDNRFKFYGVDSSLFYRMISCKDISVNNQKLLPGFEHSLSRLEVETSEVNQFRRKERGNDLGLTLRNYFPFYLSVLYLLFYSTYYLCRTFLGRGTNISLRNILLSFVKNSAK